MRVAAASVLMGLPLAPIYAQEPSAKGVNFYPLEREIETGQETAARLARVLPVIHEPRIDAWLDGLAAELARHADPRFAYSFTLYDDRKPLGLPGIGMAMPLDAFHGRATEPVALPGGPILIPLSLLANSPGEAPFAFQLAHAMAHVALRHSTRQATRQEIQSLATASLQNVSAAGNAILSSERLAMDASLFLFARRFELEADTLATGILAEAGYHPETVIPYLQGQPPADRTGVSRLFAAHPTTERREETVRAKLEALPERRYRTPSGEFDAIKTLAASILQ
ncbi:MAG TPA: M48 family metalloprotease [Bryobacteraceae bacterium]|nr:M48 family metalloprotease [Bryobacteraceae bacterium]